MGRKIVFLDTATLDYGDIDFSAIGNLGSLTCYRTTSPDKVIERCGDAEIIITNKVVIDSAVIAACGGLKMIAEAATGYNNIDVTEAKKRGIAVANVPGYSTDSVAQLTLTMMLALSTNLIKYNNAAHDGTWCASETFTLGSWHFSDLAGKTVGIMGLGAIGKEVARLCSAFGMSVVALSRGDSPRIPELYRRLDIHELAASSDFISIHMPLTDYSKRIVDRDFFSRMKKTAFLINMARGPIVDPEALNEALQKNIIAGVALDVMESEPPRADDPLLKAPNLIITPHIGWGSIESRKRLVAEIAGNIRSFTEGAGRNLVS